jgi:hypothetical protein
MVFVDMVKRQFTGAGKLNSWMLLPHMMKKNELIILNV